MTVQNLEDVVAFGKANVEALVKSSSVTVKGFEDLAKAYSSLANQSIEQTTNAVKALTSAKSPTEFQTIYTGLAKTSLENFVAESRKIQELANSIVTSSFAPLNARVQALSGLFKAA
ncbi:phasin family protein [Telmatospirillum sp.]|uniref:phasin family protein n=1 Tax=Telmatospirillum sp. TaxID=2079197 RepID=UPI0028475CC6|nr:phasin family protein [Telmatospirillum sp.]MDR3438509.1 phasin family protein [Telmatospirillum sp.]